MTVLSHNMMEYLFFFFLKKARICSKNYLGQETRKGTKATGERRLGCSGHWEGREKGAMGTGSGVSQDKCPLLPWGRDHLPEREGEGKGLAGRAP